MTVREAAPSGLPIIGHLPSLRQDPLASFAGCMDESGAAVRCRLSGDGYVLNDPEDVRHVLVGNTGNYVKSRRVAGPRGTYPRARSLLMTEGLGRSELDWVISIARRDNSRSLRVMDKLGMGREGAARWKGSDMVWYSIARGAWLDRHESAPAAAHR